MLYSRKFAVITPYYKESLDVLQRAIGSVKGLEDSGLRVTHYLISDGHPHDIQDDTLVHIKLPEAHADYGDTPRMVGAILAIRDGCYGLMFLDADNILYPEHLKLAWQAHQEHKTDVVLARRLMLREDASVIPYESDTYPNASHVDTGCYVFFGERIYDALEWAKIPNKLSVVGDRYFWKMLSGKHRDDSKSAKFFSKLPLVVRRYLGKVLDNESKNTFGVIAKPTVGYTCLWQNVYISAGETPPANAKLPDLQQHDDFYGQLSESEKIILNQRLSLRG